MEDMWFRKTKYFYAPVSWEGWSVTALYAVALIYSFWMSASNSHSLGSTVLSFVPVLILATIIFFIIARDKTPPDQQ